MQTKIAITLEVEERKLSLSHLSIPLSILDRHKIKATFFILGRLAAQSPEMLIKILSRGHELGCHGYRHHAYDEKGFNEVKADAEKGTKVIREFCDITSFRSPYFRPHKKLATILEALNYQYDSSVPSKRFDLFLGRTNNPYNLLAPTKPYHPCRENIFQRGQSKILEIPLSGFIFSLLGVTMRNLGFDIFTSLINLINLFSDFLVFDIHVWEFTEVPHPGLPHLRRRGKDTAIMFDALLHRLKDVGTFTTFSDLQDHQIGTSV